VNEIKTGAWKEIQLEFHNFKVIEDLGMKFPTENSKHKKRYVRVKCKLCLIQYEGQYALFKSRDKVCKCKSRKGKGVIAWSNPKRDRILHIRTGMIYRCYNKKSHAFERYGAKGITVCNEWRENPEIFYQWALNNGYEDGLTIERIDNSKGYSPENCCWITRSKQSKNKSNILKIENVKIIKKMLEEKIRHKDIASATGASLNAIRRISCGTTWKDII
jgi:hypothetical protein